MFGVNERREAAGLLGVGDDVQHQGCFAGRFRSVNFNDATARHAADAEREIQRQRAGGDDVNFDVCLRIAEAHDRAFTVGFGDGGDGGIQFARARGAGFGFDNGFVSGLFSGFGGHKFGSDFLLNG